MKRRFLGVRCPRLDELVVTVASDAAELVAAPRGRASALLPIRPDGPPAALTEQGVIVFLFPRKASALASQIVNDLDSSLRDACYLTHGHAAVVALLPDDDAASGLLEQVDGALLAWEKWPHSDGQIDPSSIRCRQGEIADGWPAISSITSDRVAFEAAAQIRQFNSNLAMLSGVVSRYAPEMRELIVWLRESIGDMVQEIGELQASGGDAATRAALARESVLIETNAVLTLFTSQVGSGVIPLSESPFAVGEYSLLGIGGMCRAAWRIYEHLNGTFARFGHASAIQQSYTVAGPFDVFGPSQRADFTAWADSPCNLARLPAASAATTPRYHVPYFSSRWGFHEALHSISISWQCLHASATKEWNLLTVTHEFLHAHVREIFDQVLDPTAGATFDSLAVRHRNRDSGRNAMEAMQVAVVEAVVGLRSAAKLAPQIPGDSVVKVSASVPDRMDPAGVVELIRAHSGLMHEVIVHVLDFYYTYAGRDADFINSIWSSWSLVPAVIDNIDVYILRTLSALASTAPHGSAESSEFLFTDAVGRLRPHLEAIVGRARIRPAITRALDLLNDDVQARRLRVRFFGTRYIVELARNFFFDERLNAALLRDDRTVVRDDRTTYDVQVGEFLGESPESPIGFLLDRFNGYSDQAGTVEAEYESIWQLIQVT